VGDPIPVLALLAACSLILVGSTRVGPATSLTLSGLWAPQGRNDWPRGVQEMDAPQFAVTHLDTLQPGTPIMLGAAATDDAADRDEPRPEMVELFDRPLRDGPAR
jgi:hypothetical protein